MRDFQKGKKIMLSPTHPCLCNQQAGEGVVPRRLFLFLHKMTKKRKKKKKTVVMVMTTQFVLGNLSQQTL